MQPDPTTTRLIRTIVDIIRENRESLGVSKKRLAEDSGTSRTAIILMERHERSPSLELVLRLSHSLHLSFSDVVQEAERRTRRK